MRRAWTLGCAVLCACGWFDSGRECKEGRWSCDGDQVQLCVPDPTRAGPEGPATSWRTVQTCEDDPRAGARTCAVLEERAACVRESEDGGVVAEGREESADYLRVDVSAGGEIVGVQPQTLLGAPMGAVSGNFAVAAYRDGKPLDAALAQFDPDATETTVWVRADGATSIAVVDAKGRKMEERVLELASTTEGLSLRQALLSAEMPPTLRVVTPDMKRSPPWEWELALLVAREPTAEMLALVGPALLQVPPVGLSGLREVAFADSLLRLAVDAGAGDGGAELGEAGAEDAVVSSGAPSLPDRTRVVVRGKTLWIDVTAERLAEYRASEEARKELALELVRLVGRAFVAIASYKVDEAAPILLPSDFPAELAELLRQRITPMLEVGESFADAWANLHAIGVYMGVSKGYGSSKYGDREAVDVGFAAARGVASPQADFAEYLARATIVDSWPDGPCKELQGQQLEDLAPRRFANLAKLEVLRGLGVLGGDRVVACTGPLASKMKTPAIVLHKASGEQVWFEKEPTGARAEWGNAVTVLATAARDAVQAVVNVQYRSGALPSVMRLGKVANPIALPQSASFGLTNPAKRENAGAEGGLVVIDKVTRTEIEAHLLMVSIAKPRLTIDDVVMHPEWLEGPFGNWWYPLITIRVSTPGWQDESFYADL